jgi:PAS domain S-box-containing protein
LERGFDFYRLILDNLPDLVLVLDEGGKVAFVSPSVKELLGYRPEELEGRDFLGFIHPEDRDSARSNLRIALEREGTTRYSVQRVRHRDGTWRYFEASALNLLRDPRVEGLLVNARDVTRRVELEREIRESRRQMATLLSNLPGMAYRCLNDPEWTMLFVSEGCRELTGYEPSDLVSNTRVSYGELIHPEDRGHVWEVVQKALGRRETFRLVYRILPARGDVKWVWEQGRGVFSDKGKLLYLEGFITDITERTWGERALEVQRNLALAEVTAKDFDDFASRALEIIGGAAMLDFTCLFLDEGGAYRLACSWGVPEELLSALKRSEKAVRTSGKGGISGPAGRSIQELKLAGFLRGLGKDVVAFPLVHEGREVGWLLAGNRKEPLPAKARALVEMAASEISHALSRELLQEQLRESEYRYRLLFEQAGEAIFTYDPSLRITDVNRKGCETLGMDRRELVGRNLLELGILCREDVKRAEEDINLVLQGETVREREYRLRRKDGAIILLQMTGAPVLDEEGRVVEVVTVARDITGQRRAEEALRSREAHYRATFETTGTAMFLVDRRGMITEANWEAERLLGYAREEMAGKKRYMDLLVPQEVERIKDISRRLLSGELISPLQLEITVHHRSGRPIPTLATVSLIPGTEESVVSLLDISRMKEYQAEILKREKELRDFLDLAAHELRHPATLLKGYAVTLKEHGERMDEETRRYALEAMDRGANRLVHVVEELLEMIRLGKGRMNLEIEDLEPGQVAARAVEEVRSRFPGREIVLRVDEGTGKVRGDAEKLERLLVILLDNAVKFSPEGSLVELEVKREGRVVLFSVMDRGRGVPEECRERIFDRFYQVEDVLHHSTPGLGLGLYIAREIAEAHGGRLWHEHRPGGGSIFRLALEASR